MHTRTQTHTHTHTHNMDILPVSLSVKNFVGGFSSPHVIITDTTHIHTMHSYCCSVCLFACLIAQRYCEMERNGKDWWRAFWIPHKIKHPSILSAQSEEQEDMTGNNDFHLFIIYATSTHQFYSHPRMYIAVTYSHIIMRKELEKSVRCSHNTIHTHMCTSRSILVLSCTRGWICPHCKIPFFEQCMTGKEEKSIQEAQLHCVYGTV